MKKNGLEMAGPLLHILISYATNIPQLFYSFLSSMRPSHLPLSGWYSSLSVVLFLATGFSSFCLPFIPTIYFSPYFYSPHPLLIFPLLLFFFFFLSVYFSTPISSSSLSVSPSLPQTLTIYPLSVSHLSLASFTLPSLVFPFLSPTIPSLSYAPSPSLSPSLPSLQHLHSS